jgi:valyl-tRNA synthetase
MISSPAGNDLLWDESSNEQGRNFSNKIWNALKLLKIWEERKAVDMALNGEDARKAYFAINWFEARLAQVKEELEVSYKQFRLSEALKTLYTLIWDDFCSWYLEWVKPAYGTDTIDAHVLARTKTYFEELMKMLHPFMPFITEEIYHELGERKAGEDLCVSLLSPVNAISNAEEILRYGSMLQECITGIRDAKTKSQLKPREEVELHVQSSAPSAYDFIGEILAKQVSASSLSITTEAIPQAIPAMAGKEKFYITTSTPIDTGNQKEELIKDLEYLRGFLVSVEKKLGNERFISNAKAEVIEIEKKKKADAEKKIQMLEESLTTLN